MEGVSKEYLIKIYQEELGIEPMVNLLWLVDFKCKELDPWLPVDADTPRDRCLLLYNPLGDEGYRQWVGIIREDMRCPPTHYKLLSPDPKE